MYQGSYVLSDGSPVTKFVIAQKAKAIQLAISYNGPEYSTPADAVGSLRAALNGKMSLTLQSQNPARTINMVPNLKVGDVIECYASQRGMVVIDTLSLGSGAYRHTAYVSVPISLNGAVDLGSNQTVTLEFNGCTNTILTGSIHYDTIVRVSTETAPVDVKDVVIINPVNIPNGAATSFSVQSYSTLVVPATMDKLTMFAGSGNSSELVAADLPAFAKLTTRPNFIVDGVACHYVDFVGFNTLLQKSAQLSLTSGTQAFQLATMGI